MKYTVHVPDKFAHLDLLHHHVNKLGLSSESLPKSKSFKLGGSDEGLQSFLKYVERFKAAGVVVLDSTPHDPKVVSPYITSVSPKNSLSYRSVSYFNPIQIASVYGLTAQQTARVGIAIIELGGGYNPSDLAAYWSYLGLKTIPNVTAISVDGAQNTPGNDADYEVVLDIEVIGGICPNSNIYVYFAPNTGNGFYDAINAAISSTTNPVSIVSISWGGPENGWSSEALQSYNTLFEKAAAAGITVCVASGDNSASDGESGLHVDFPASSPWVLACGGTHLVCPDFNYTSPTTSESVWGTGNAQSGGAGGGFSTTFSRPSYQTAATANYSTPGRAVPDVSGDADPSTGWNIYIRGSHTIIGGTSAVAPLWAGLLGLLNFKQFLNPILYSSWATNPKVVHDIVTGSEGFQAAKGWDPASGLGTPNGSVLLPILSAYNTINPPPITPPPNCQPPCCPCTSNT